MIFQCRLAVLLLTVIFWSTLLQCLSAPDDEEVADRLLAEG